MIHRAEQTTKRLIKFVNKLQENVNYESKPVTEQNFVQTEMTFSRIPHISTIIDVGSYHNLPYIYIYEHNKCYHLSEHPSDIELKIIARKIVGKL